jgi:AraC family transcriptional regulator of adaptative response / DNA-3-methyladenine glycosylase II
MTTATGVRMLLAMPGIGAWTAAYIALRALADPDGFPAADLGIRRAARSLHLPDKPSALLERAEAWRGGRGVPMQRNTSGL